MSPSRRFTFARSAELRIDGHLNGEPKNQRELFDQVLAALDHTAANIAGKVMADPLAQVLRPDTHEADQPHPGRPSSPPYSVTIAVTVSHTAVDAPPPHSCDLER